ncbi:hypothetical protein RK055_03680, partial [Streptococcus pneumoniae]|nr:hypothetical protein [Streptococcus pneumoniae]MDS2915721.1 hypothetical protein [Streptococcus pneumoniae]MDS3608402.1 hypothetical protein [Streptococcus pneumoniae]MDS9115663.1 hypothetical protein [Streptococcus pneumoniae]MDS9229629.1 hypothetical protein [Streptococcus pneumoniae]
MVVGIAIASGYLNSRLDKFVDWGLWTALVPFGLISVTNVGISMLSTRFTGKLSKWGNPNHSYLSQLDVTYKTPDLMSHFLPP